MARENIVVGLDIGTSKIAAIIGDISLGNPEQIEIIGVGVSDSHGLRKGVVVDIEKTASSIREAVEAAELMAGVEIGSVFAGIAGGHIQGMTMSGVVAVSGPDHEITEADVNRAISAAQALAIPVEREVIHAIPQGFVVDKQEGIREPVGMCGVRLEAYVHIVTGAVASAQNLVRSVYMAGLSVQDIVLEPLASSEGVLTPNEREFGAVLVDIGGGTTDVAIYKDSALMHTAVVSYGGSTVTNDVAMVLKMPPPEAETLKCRSGAALVDIVDPHEMISIPSMGEGRRPRVLPRQILARVVEDRMREVLGLVEQEIRKSELIIPGGVVLTGGTSLLEGLPELAQEVFGMPVRIGYPQPLKGLIDKVNNPIYATGVGLLIFGAKSCLQSGGKPGFIKGNVFDEILKRMKAWFRDYI